MHVGAHTLPTDRSAPPTDLARAVEQRGLESLFFGDHTHIPVDRRSRFPLADELPEEYLRMHDPYVACALAAAVTERIRVGTCVTLIAQRDPIVTAKQVASVDVASGGRFELGVGHGWNVEEAANHGVEWSTRRRRVRETVQAMRALWADDEAEYHGDLIDFDPVWMWPKPVQRPGPPVSLGAGPGPKNFDAIVTWADGWMPVPYFGHTPDHVTELRRVAEEAGRDPSTLTITVDGVFPVPEQIDPWLEIGVDRVLVPLPSEPLDAVLPLLDQAAELVQRVR